MVMLVAVTMVMMMDMVVVLEALVVMTILMMTLKTQPLRGVMPSTPGYESVGPGSIPA